MLPKDYDDWRLATPWDNDDYCCVNCGEELNKDGVCEECEGCDGYEEDFLTIRARGER